MSRVRKNRSAERSERKNLPLLTFEEKAEKVLLDFTKDLPSSFTCDDLATEIDRYLELAGQRIRLPQGAGRREVLAIDIEGYLERKFAGEDYALYDQDDFKRSAEVLLTDDNFPMLSGKIKLLHSCARTLGLSWDQTESGIRKAADKLRPDKRPELVRRGEFCERVLSELKEIRRRRAEFQGFPELLALFPNFETIRVLKGPPFDAEDRDEIAHPNRAAHTSQCNGKM
jgi:hypothetical protein